MFHAAGSAQHQALWNSEFPCLCRDPTSSLATPFAPRIPQLPVMPTWALLRALFIRFVTTTMWSDFQHNYLTRLYELVLPCERQSRALVLDLPGSDKTHPCMQRVYDSEERLWHSHSAPKPIAFPVHPTRSAFLTMISELNTAPATSPVNA